MIKKFLVDTKKNTISNSKSWAIILVAQFLLFYLLSKLDFAVSFFSKFFEWKKNWHIALFSGVSFSIGDLIYIILGLFTCYFLLMSIKFRTSKYIKYLLIIGNIFYFTYQCFWGMLYFQPTIIQKLPNRKVTDVEIKNLTIKYLNLCKSERAKLNEDKNGILKVLDFAKIKQEIINQQKLLPKNISTKNSIDIISIKPSLFRGFMSKTGILGYYNPFTSEAQYNPNIPSTQLPFTMAHEMSHQLGFAREQEASFIGFLCAHTSQIPELRYSANLYALRSLIKAVSYRDKRFAELIFKSFSSKMKRDIEYELQYVKRNEGIVNDFFGVTNDLFLKSNQQQGSITYSYFVNLLIAYEI